MIKRFLAFIVRQLMIYFVGCWYVLENGGDKEGAAQMEDSVRRCERIIAKLTGGQGSPTTKEVRNEHKAGREL